ncbi:hypothetical protein M427DRAFT_50884, partial [Gonapodya prolifera JEL478]
MAVFFSLGSFRWGVRPFDNNDHHGDICRRFPPPSGLRTCSWNTFKAESHGPHSSI